MGVALIHPGSRRGKGREGMPWWAASVPMLLSGCGGLRTGLEGKPPKPPTRKRSQWNSRPWAQELKILRRQDTCEPQISHVHTDMKKGADRAVSKQNPVPGASVRARCENPVRKPSAKGGTAGTTKGDLREFTLPRSSNPLHWNHRFCRSNRKSWIRS